VKKIYSQFAAKRKGLGAPIDDTGKKWWDPMGRTKGQLRERWGARMWQKAD